MIGAKGFPLGAAYQEISGSLPARRERSWAGCRWVAGYTFSGAPEAVPFDTRAPGSTDNDNVMRGG